MGNFGPLGRVWSRGQALRPPAVQGTPDARTCSPSEHIAPAKLLTSCQLHQESIEWCSGESNLVRKGACASRRMYACARHGSCDAGEEAKELMTTNVHVAHRAMSWRVCCLVAAAVIIAASWEPIACSQVRKECPELLAGGRTQQLDPHIL